MKIRYLSGPKAGQVENVENSVGRFGIASGLAEEVERSENDRRVVSNGLINGEVPYSLPKPGSAPAPIPHFEVIEYAGVDRRWLAIKMQIGSAVTFYSGDPKAIKLIGGWPCPKEIAAEYAQQYRANPLMRATQMSLPDEDSNVNVRAGDAKARANEDLRQNEAGLREELARR